MRKMVRLSLAISGAIFAVSCVSAPAPVKAPDWTMTTPAPDATFTYFVASSSDSAGDTALATEDAAIGLISQITRYMGVDISVATTGEAKGTLDSYTADVTSVVKQTGASKVSGFSIKDRFAVRDGKAVTVYVLAQYMTADLNKEKARIAALFKEKEDAVAKPEAAGDSAASSGRFFDAIKSYAAAVVAASGSDIDNAGIKLERNANKARALLGKIRFARLDAPTTAGLGKDYSKPFKARLTFGEGDSAPGIPGAEVYVAYQRRQSSGRIVSRTERAMTDQDGVVSFAPPPPDFVGKATLSFSLNLDSTKELLDSVPPTYSAFVEAIAEEMKRRSVSFEYTIASAARTVPTGVVVIDLGDDGKPAATSIAQGGLFETLAKEKFKAGLAPLSAAMVAALDDDGILKAARAQYGSGLARLIYGVARIDGAAKDGSMWQATARMTVRCVEFSTGTILYSTEKTAITVASDEASARRAALLQVAKDAVAKDLMANLP
ncbi:MAG: hypothetical protein KKA67_07825 [Spirochaetes bacterium]|nr:hypothetical protein [Spirochaetota bacterium]MBU1082080.1 hypothetical protein [Spirochaetota bacterium]